MLTEHTLWSIAWESYIEPLIHFAFKPSNNTQVKYDFLYFTCHPFCLSPTTPLNITSVSYCPLATHWIFHCSLIKTGLPFVLLQWQAVTVTLISTLLEGYDVVTQACATALAGSRMWHAVCVCVSVCCHGKINTGWKANEKLEQVCGVQPQTFTEMRRISSQFHGLLVWHREFIWD